MNKRLGQHFLINESAIKKIVAALDLEPTDIIIEIGPGKGALTDELASQLTGKSGYKKLILIEKDRDLAAGLYKKYFQNKQIEIINDDALKALLKLTGKKNNYKIIGNIPYYITGKLLRILSELEKKPELTVLMVQKEVAERIFSSPPQMNLLAAAVQFWAEPKILLTLKPEDFDPPPKINSAVIKLTTINKRQLTSDNDKYYKLLHIIFKQPRKTLMNNLKSGLDLSKNDIERALSSLKIDKNSRPQNLSLKQIKALITIIQP